MDERVVCIGAFLIMVAVLFAIGVTLVTEAGEMRNLFYIVSAFPGLMGTIFVVLGLSMKGLMED